MTSEPLQVAVVGVGRIGRFHAGHVMAVGARHGGCELVAGVDDYSDAADRVAAQLSPAAGRDVRAFRQVEDLIAADLSAVTIVASRTSDHHHHCRTLVDAGQRVLLEKPLTDTVESGIELASYLNASARSREAVMIGFMRRFDAALVRAKELLEAGAIGRLFKIVSILEDPVSPPTGYSSSGMLGDMGVHNADEVMWLTGLRPTSVEGFGSRLHNQYVSDVAEDFDDGFVQLRFAERENLCAQIVVTRNHVSGYRNETFLYGDEGMIHSGRFAPRAGDVNFEAYRKGGEVVEEHVFVDSRHHSEGDVPKFIERFGDAYLAQVEHFVAQCRSGEPFAAADHDDGLRAMQVVEAGMWAQRQPREGVPISY